jgi:hypothetical protein
MRCGVLLQTHVTKHTHPLPPPAHPCAGRPAGKHPGHPPIPKNQAFRSWLAFRFQSSHKDSIRASTCSNNSVAGGASGTKAKSCCFHSLRATASKSSDKKAYGFSKEMPLTAHFLSTREIKFGDIMSCGRLGIYELLKFSRICQRLFLGASSSRPRSRG